MEGSARASQRVPPDCMVVPNCPYVLVGYHPRHEMFFFYGSACLPTVSCGYLLTVECLVSAPAVLRWGRSTASTGEVYIHVYDVPFELSSCVPRALMSASVRPRL